MPLTIQPYLISSDVDLSLAFYQSLGFETVSDEAFPYRFAEVRDGELWLIMSSLAQFGGKKAFGAFIVTVPDLLERYERYADHLRQVLGKIPLHGIPRMSRLTRDRGAFNIFDPAGNMLIFMQRGYSAPPYAEAASPIEEALTNAWFQRDTYCNDAAAAKVLDRAITAVSAEIDLLGRALARGKGGNRRGNGAGGQGCRD